MPLYEYECSCGVEFERQLPLSRYKEPQYCKCGQRAKKLISRPMAGYVSREVNYDSPIDGRPITSWAQRREDLARNGCREYDPEMKTDYKRRIQREEAELDKKIESTVEAEIERMPGDKREALHNDLKHGAEAVPERGTAPLTTIRSIDNA